MLCHGPTFPSSSACRSCDANSLLRHFPILPSVFSSGKDYRCAILFHHRKPELCSWWCSELRCRVPSGHERQKDISLNMRIQENSKKQKLCAFVYGGAFVISHRKEVWRIGRKLSGSGCENSSSSRHLQRRELSTAKERPVILVDEIKGQETRQDSILPYQRDERRAMKREYPHSSTSSPIGITTCDPARHADACHQP